MSPATASPATALLAPFTPFPTERNATQSGRAPPRGTANGNPQEMLPLLRWPCFLLFVLLLISEPSVGFFGWLTRRASPENHPTPQAAAPDPGNLSPVPFEMTTGDDRFLAEARHLDLSPLDSCHYEVISQLQSSCADLSEEELAKLSVSLFNCQASIEGRRTFLCTSGMTLAECTTEMDPDTWNAYHIVSNRARAVCYTTRQMQFKRQTEHTVNTLVSTAVSQLEAMKILKNGQAELKELTSASLQNVASSQQELLAQQAKLQGSQDQMEESIHGNLDRLAEEKALIASGHQQVAQLIDGITKRMENVSKHLDNQDVDLQEGHKAILQDLTQVQERAHEVYSKLETNLGLLLAYQNQTALYYEELMEKLQKMNQSLGLVLFGIERMQSSVEGRLQHIQRFINWAGFSLSSIYICVLHGSYFLLAAFVMTFLQIPGLPRALLLVLVVANALSELNQAASLGFKSLTSLLVLAVTGNWLLEKACCCALQGRLQKTGLMFFPQRALEYITTRVELKVAGSSRTTSTPDRNCDVGLLEEELEKLEEMSCVSGQDHLGRDSPAKGDLLLDEATVLHPAGWASPQGHSLHPMKLRRFSLIHSTRHEIQLFNVSKDAVPGSHPDWTAVPEKGCPRPRETLCFLDFGKEEIKAEVPFLTLLFEDF
ncbi:protein brambleberry-like [Eublepharis macularius]|uniref:Protein brambleberry-like n=1 Tax=Eublepharis macularius TaxID=481883 RepID=A0AA97JMX4_EUBMA|nr:protein brambleberry-like [Eublepharis macularius]